MTYRLAGITKLEAAHRHLNAAIRLYFSEADPVAVWTLAGAASIVFTDLAGLKSPDDWRDRMAWEANKISRGDYFKLLRDVQNALKHAREDPDAVIDLDLRHLEDLMLGATFNAGPLGGISMSESVFQFWYFATRPDMFPADFQHLKAASEYFPGIRELEPAQQRKFGMQRLLAERATERDSGGGTR